MRVSIIIPVYNELEYLKEVFRRIMASEPPDWEKEIIFIDDGSTDGSGWLIQQLVHSHKKEHVKLITFPENRGKGAAVRAGFQAATGDVLMIQDADLETDPADHPLLLEPIAADEADVVFGSRYLGRDHRIGSFWLHKGNQFLTKLTNLIANVYLTDMGTCFKVCRREVINSLDLRENGFGIDPELTIKIIRGGWRIMEVPVRYFPRTYQEGKKIKIKDGLREIYCLFRYGFTTAKIPIRRDQRFSGTINRAEPAGGAAASGQSTEEDVQDRSA